MNERESLQLPSKFFSLSRGGDTHHRAAALADDDSAPEMQVVAIGELEGVEVGKEEFDAGRLCTETFQHVGQDRGVQCASVGVE